MRRAARRRSPRRTWRGRRASGCGASRTAPLPDPPWPSVTAGCDRPDTEAPNGGSSVRPVTGDREQLEQPLGDARMQAVYEAMACGVIVRNAALEVVYANRAAL